MFTLDVPADVPNQYAPIVIADGSPEQSEGTREHTIGVCHLVENSQYQYGTTATPAAAVWIYLNKQKPALAKQITPEMYKSAKVTVLRPPRAGETRKYCCCLR